MAGAARQCVCWVIGAFVEPGLAIRGRPEVGLISRALFLPAGRALSQGKGGWALFYGEEVLRGFHKEGDSRGFTGSVHGKGVQGHDILGGRLWGTHRKGSSGAHGEET